MEWICVNAECGRVFESGGNAGAEPCVWCGCRHVVAVEQIEERAAMIEYSEAPGVIARERAEFLACASTIVAVTGGKASAEHARALLLQLQKNNMGCAT